MGSLYLNGVYYMSKDVLVGLMVDLAMSKVYDKNSLYVSKDESTTLDLFEQLLKRVDNATEGKEGLCKDFANRYEKRRYRNLV